LGVRWPQIAVAFTSHTAGLTHDEIVINLAGILSDIHRSHAQSGDLGFGGLRCARMHHARPMHGVGRGGALHAWCNWKIQ
jgi:hypothetical protein